MQQELKQRNGYKLCFSPGVAQVFYGDESSSLIVEGTEGDATLRALYELGKTFSQILLHKSTFTLQKT
jgi:hypothetical protein